MIYLLT